MLKIGLTGCMGSGKSTISKELSKYTNIFVSDSDKIVTFLLENCEEIRNQINKEFGTLDRIKLGK